MPLLQCWDILGCFWTFLYILGHKGYFGDILRHFGTCWDVLGRFWVALGCFEMFKKKLENFGMFLKDLDVFERFGTVQGYFGTFFY